MDSGLVLGSRKTELQIRGANINATDTSGATTLDWAFKVGEKEIADLLRKHGSKTGEELKAEGK